MGWKARPKVNKAWNTPPPHRRGPQWNPPDRAAPEHRGPPVRTLADMSAEEVAAIEALYGAPVVR